jgi:hypothetical protein
MPWRCGHVCKSPVAVSSSGGTTWEGGSRANSAWRRTNAFTTSSFSSGSSEQVAYTSRPPTRTNAAAAPSRDACRAAAPTAAPGDNLQRASGWRAIVPVAVHGASTRTASNAPGANGAARRSAPTTRIATPARRAVPCSRSRRARRASPATTRAPSFSNATALPPGAAHASYTRAPGGIAAKRQTRAAAGSCTTNPPSWYPGRERGGGNLAPAEPATSRRPAPNGAGSLTTPAAARRSRRTSALHRAGCRTMAGRASFHAARRAVSSSPRRSRHRRTSQAGCEDVAA